VCTLFLVSTYGNTNLEHAAWSNQSSTRTLCRQTTGQSSYRRSGQRILELVQQRGGGVPAVQHRRRGEPVLQLSSCPAGDDSEPHRRSGGGGPTSHGPLHGAPLLPLGCPPAYRYSAGGAAFQSPTSGGAETVGAVGRDASPVSQAETLRLEALSACWPSLLDDGDR
jgi:hypothetical protein